MKIALIIALFCAAVARADDETIRIAAFGDSLSAGYGLPEADGFAPVLQKELRAAGVPAEVVNAAVSGDTSADGLLRVDWMLRETSPDIVVVEFGANDMFRGLPAAHIEKNLAEIIARIQQNGARVLLAGMEAPRNYGAQYRRQFSAMYESLGARFGAPLYPFFLDGVALDPNLNLADGIHPNAAGVREIARNIAPFVAALARP
ncbi:MAG: arylesterase [Gammaproteobacteria bacterium]